ncbi:hypothetical protein GCM10028810_06010 [Spirosoma litoris]
MRWHQFFGNNPFYPMKATLFSILIWAIIQSNTRAQSTNLIRVRGGVSETKTLPFSERYCYEQFRNGTLLFVNGTSAAARFNYNILLGEMQFINAQGDTLAITDQPVVRLVSIDNPAPGDQAPPQDIFWHDPKLGYMELIDTYGLVKLAEKRVLEMAKGEKLGAYNQSSGTASITNYQFYSSDNASIRKFDAKGDLLLIKGKTYFIIDQNNRSYLLNKTSLLKVFGKHREQVMAYLATESVDFKQANDLKKLLAYCSKLL